MNIFKMWKISIRFTFLLLVWAICFEVPGFSESGRKSLWKVTSDSTTVYLLGSIHFLTPESYPLEPSIEQAFSECVNAVFEMNLDEANSLEVQSMMMMKSMFQEGETLRSSLSTAAYALASGAAKMIGISIEQYNGFKPWFFALTLVAIKIQQLGFNPEYGIDAYFFKKAKKREINIVGLETAVFQIEVLETLHQEDQEALLLQTIDELDMMDHELNKLVDAWETGQSDTMEQILLSSFKAYPNIYNTMVVQRNKNWLPKIESYLKKPDKTIFIVGTAHLIGPDGLIKSLVDLGYSVIQIGE